MATYRFYAQLQKGRSNLATSAATFSSSPTNSQAISVIEGIRGKGRGKLPRDAHGNFESAVDEMIRWIRNLRGSGMSFDGNGDVHRKAFRCNGDEYRLDIGIGGETSGKWFV